MDRFSVIGRATPRMEGPDKVRGYVAYAADQIFPRMVWGKTVRSALPHARIIRVDTSKARAYPGVLAVLTAEDVPDVLVGRQLQDTPVLARDRVRFIGEKIAVVGAVGREISEEAAALVEVEYDELAAVFDPHEAMREGAPVLHENMASYGNLPKPIPKIPNVHSHAQWRMGDSKKGFSESDLIFEQSFATQRAHQGYLEPHAGLVRIDEQGRIVVWCSNKVPFPSRKYLAQAIGVDEQRIVVHLSPVGGDFGGKGALMDVPLCYFLTKATGRPAKMVMTYAEELMAANPRHPSTVTVKTGVKAGGRIWAREVKAVFNSGAYGGFKPNIIVNLPGARAGGGAYDIPHLKIDAYSVYTNCVPGGHVRGPGEAQVVFAVESHMDYIARQMGLDPYEFRRMNVLKSGDLLPTGVPLESSKGPELLEKLRAKLGASSATRGRTLAGKGVAISLKEAHHGEANSEVGLDHAGEVYVLTTVPDTGTGAHTIFRQIVGETVGLSSGKIKVIVGNTDTFENDVAVGGSRVTYLSGQAVYSAARDLRKRLVDLAASQFGCPPEDIRISGGFVCGPGRKKMSLSDLARLGASRGVGLKVSANFKSPPGAGGVSFFGQGAEVEVDPETGQVKILKIVSAHDVATILNPVTHQGQIEGGMIQGLGFSLMEDLRDEDGKIVPLTLGDYKMPNVKDIPRHETIFVRDSRGPAPFDSKPIGEHSTSPTAAAIANAIYDATGIQIMETPITAEKVYRALQKENGARPASRSRDEKLGSKRSSRSSRSSPRLWEDTGGGLNDWNFLNELNAGGPAKEEAWHCT
ncbi:MAG: xanthine dehydrogenase family protein molybdopterin-binding subunit [Candidatus Binatia bacterium]